jgi:hypothetical protein
MTMQSPVSDVTSQPTSGNSIVPSVAEQQRDDMSVTEKVPFVWVEEEYGYRYWLWKPDMTEPELIAFWKNMPAIGSVLNLPGKLESLPGELEEIVPIELDEDIDELSAKAIILREEGKYEEANALFAPCEGYAAPGDWFAHIHEDEDSFLRKGKRRWLHAGYVPWSDPDEPEGDSEEKVKQGLDS